MTYPKLIKECYLAQYVNYQQKEIVQKNSTNI